MPGAARREGCVRGQEGLPVAANHSATPSTSRANETSDVTSSWVAPATADAPPRQGDEGDDGQGRQLEGDEPRADVAAGGDDDGAGEGREEQHGLDRLAGRVGGPAPGWPAARPARCRPQQRAAAASCRVELQRVGLPEADLRAGPRRRRRRAASVAAAPAPVRCRTSSRVEPPPWAETGDRRHRGGERRRAPRWRRARGAGEARRGRRRARGRARRPGAAPAAARRSRRRRLIRAAPPLRRSGGPRRGPRCPSSSCGSDAEHDDRDDEGQDDGPPGARGRRATGSAAASRGAATGSPSPDHTIRATRSE